MKALVDIAKNNWLKGTPTEWEILRIKNLFELSKEKNHGSDLPVLSLTQRGIKLRDISNNEGQLAESYENYTRIRPDDLVFNPMDLRTGAVDLSISDGVISLAYSVLRKRHKVEVFLKYYKYYFQWHYLCEILFPFGQGVSVDHRWTLKDNILLNFPILIPPLENQKRIAEFLDLKTKIIDQIIEKKKKLIELLKEKRISIITQAVTKGLDPKAKMKPSGVEWIGEIPEEWKIKKLKYCFRLLQAKSDETEHQNKISLENIESWTGKYIETDVNYDGSGVKFKKNDILFGKLRPYLAKVYLGMDEGIAFGDILVYRPLSEITNEFGFYSFISYRFIELINSHTYGVKMPRSNPETIGSLIFLIPSKKEQNIIVEFLKKELTNNNKIIEIQNKQIDKLIEYRSSLIYNAVTGKIKI